LAKKHSLILAKNNYFATKPTKTLIVCVSHRVGVSMYGLSGISLLTNTTNVTTCTDGDERRQCEAIVGEDGRRMSSRDVTMQLCDYFSDYRHFLYHSL
jgi:hypothetical protein